MIDWFVLLGFIAMILAPCLVAMSTGVPYGAELGVRDLTEPRFEDLDKSFIPNRQRSTVNPS